MGLSGLIVVQWLHVLAGATMLGGYAFMAFAVWPMLLDQPPKAAGATYERIGRGAGPLMAISGNVAVVLGIIRGTWLGPIKSMEILMSTYGVTWLIALATMVFLMVYGATESRRLPAHLLSLEGDAIDEATRRAVRRSSAISLTAFGVIITCMVLMHFGL